MSPVRGYQAARLRRQLLAQAALNLVGTGFSFYFWRETPTVELAVARGVTFGVGLGVIAYLSMARPCLRMGQAIAIYFLNVAVILTMAWLSNEAAVQLARSWTPFQSHKLAVMVHSFFAPPRLWVGMVVALVYASAAAIQYLRFGPEVRIWLVDDEPWGTFLFVAMALAVFFLRLRTVKLERRLLRERLEFAIWRRLASRLLAIKDLMGSPLCTILMTADLIRRRHPDEGGALDRVDRSVDRLTDLMRLTERYGRSAREDTRQVRTGISLDPIKKLSPHKRDRSR